MTRGPWVGFVDALALILIVLFLLPTKPDEAAAEDENLGMIVIEAHWADGSRADVDLWIKTPEDSPVGYSRLRGAYASLFRDDLGNGAEPRRYEIAATREVRDGEYIVNLHFYGDAGGEAPISVNVTCWYRAPLGSRVQVWSGPVTLSARGAEVTAVRWAMQSGYMVAGSLHHTPQPLRSRVPG